MQLIRLFLRPPSRAPAVERIESARCVLHARCQELRGVAMRRSFARRRSFAKRCADPAGQRRKQRPACAALAGMLDKYAYTCAARRQEPVLAHVLVQAVIALLRHVRVHTCAHTYLHTIHP